MSSGSSYSSADESYDSDEPPELKLNLNKLKDGASHVLQARCTDVKKLTRGVHHEVFVLRFEENSATPNSLKTAGFTCIARLTRGEANAAKFLSEVSTMEYIRNSTSIPVPEVYYHDLDQGNAVGAPFMLMERFLGRHLNKIWDQLCLEDKKSALTQIASVIAQLASLKFDQIGSLHQNIPVVGPIMSPCLDQPKGPFPSTREFMQSFIFPDSVHSPQLKTHFHQISEELSRFFTLHGHAKYLQPPFCLIHADFDGQNMLFTQSPDGSGRPKLSGVLSSSLDVRMGGPERVGVLPVGVVVEGVSSSTVKLVSERKGGSEVPLAREDCNLHHNLHNGKSQMHGDEYVFLNSQSYRKLIIVPVLRTSHGN